MLLSFSAGNYKSFLEPFIFSLQPAPKQTGLDYSLLEEKTAAGTVRGLSSAVIYGPNASGKTNIIGAVDALRAIVLRGHIRNGDAAQDNRRSNMAAQRLELIPNSCVENTPVVFSIRFTTEGVLFDYRLILGLGSFLQVDAYRQVLSESLFVNEENVFVRENGKIRVSGIGKKVKNFMVATQSAEEAALRQRLAEGGLNPTELFLTNGFKAMFSHRLVEMITTWFAQKLMIIYHADSVQIFPAADDRDLKFMNRLIQPAAQTFGADAHEVVYAKNGEETGSALLYSKIGDKAVPAEIYESYGTLRFVNLFPILWQALRSGVTLFIDEFDASIHPMALMSIVNVFHNDEINVNHAQLIFNTHNPIFLNADLYRRDEIKFVERDEETGSSRQYSLADFGTAGGKGVRKGEDYLKNYFISRYGAIREVDFSEIFRQATQSLAKTDKSEGAV